MISLLTWDPRASVGESKRCVAIFLVVKNVFPGKFFGKMWFIKDILLTDQKPDWVIYHNKDGNHK